MKNTLSRRERVKLANRKAILSAAEGVFAQKGFYAATTDEIAERAEFSKGALYTYFRSKEEIFLSLMREKVGSLEKKIKESIKVTLNPIEGIENLIKAHLEFFEENKEFFQIMASERGRFEMGIKNRLRRELMRRFQSYLKEVEGVMKAAVDNKELKAIDPNHLAIALIGMIHSFTAQWILTGGESSLMELSPVITMLFFGGAKG